MSYIFWVPYHHPKVPLVAEAPPPQFSDGSYATGSAKRFSSKFTHLEIIQFHIVTIRIRHCVKFVMQA